MEIIEKPKLEEYKKVCKRCSCKFKYNKRDITVYFDETFDIQKDELVNRRFDYINCPFCNERIEVEQNGYY